MISVESLIYTREQLWPSVPGVTTQYKLVTHNIWVTVSVSPLPEVLSDQVRCGPWTLLSFTKARSVIPAKVLGATYGTNAEHFCSASESSKSYTDINLL